MPRPAVLPDALLRMPTYALSLLGQEAHDQMAAALPGGLRLGHLAVLGVLADGVARPQRALAADLRIHPSDVVAIVDALVEDRFVTREVDPADRRRRLVTVTPAGRDLVETATHDSTRIMSKLLSALDADERGTVAWLLRRAMGDPEAHQRVAASTPGPGR